MDLLSDLMLGAQAAFSAWNLAYCLLGVFLGTAIGVLPGIGPLIATAIAVLAPPPKTFRKARDFAAWLGLVPRQHSTGGKQRLGATTRMGERSLRRLLILGANSVIIKRHVHSSARPGTWLAGMLSRKPPMLVRVALANKMARIVWALMVKGQDYRAPAAAA